MILPKIFNDLAQDLAKILPKILGQELLAGPIAHVHSYMYETHRRIRNQYCLTPSHCLINALDASSEDPPVEFQVPVANKIAMMTTVCSLVDVS